MSNILYSTGCPRCMVLEKKLGQANIEFSVESDVEKMIEMGYEQAPILEVDGKPLEYGEAVKWVNAQIGGK